jgi:hypothetical protein
MGDLFEKEVGLAVAATAALMSERARRVLRRGAVYGIAGAMSVGETVTSAARSVGRDSERESSDGAGEAKAAERTSRSRQKRQPSAA